jgi:hypothetical protein
MTWLKALMQCGIRNCLGTELPDLLRLRGDSALVECL